MPLGACLARMEHISRATVRDDVLHGVTAFGGGALVSAVALVLVPEGAEGLDSAVALLLFMAGGLVFYLVDRWLQSRGGTGALLLAMLLDFLPEAMALGALLVADSGIAMLLAAMIFLQNLPEGFSAYREIIAGSSGRGLRVIGLFAGLALLGPTCAAIGFTYLADAHATLSAIMIFAAGGILYLVFEDIAPAARSAKSGLPALGAVAGFALGLGGSLFIG